MRIVILINVVFIVLTSSALGGQKSKEELKLLKEKRQLNYKLTTTRTSLLGNDKELSELNSRIKALQTLLADKLNQKQEIKDIQSQINAVNAQLSALKKKELTK